MNLPNTLTVLRIFLVPLLVVVLLAPPNRWTDSPFFGDDSPAVRELLAVAIFLLAVLTDILDGYLARRNNQITTLGTLLDPIADKLLTCSAFISLVEIRTHGFDPRPLAPAWMVVIIVGREFIVSGLRSILATRGITLAASQLGKLKTASQVVAIVLLILTNSLERWWRFGSLGVLALWISMLIALWSGLHYLLRFMRMIPELARTPSRLEDQT
jgi:CDP-diacylglycerol--glycerol-3-phosphate 3-phosphatidyltransferase